MFSKGFLSRFLNCRVNDSHCFYTLFQCGFFKRQRYDDPTTYNVKFEKKRDIDNPTYATKVETQKDYDERDYFLKH